MKTADPTNSSQSKQSNLIKKIVLGLLVLGVATITLIVFVGSVLFAFSYIRQNIESTALNIPLFSDKPVENQIAFVGNDDNLWLVGPNGKELRGITSDGQGYRFPTWSPDGRRLAFVGPSVSNNSALYVSPTFNTNPTIVYNEPKSSPFYLYWAPDSNSLTFLTQEISGLSMRQVDAKAPTANRTLGEGAPFYWAWSPTSEKMLMHVGGSRAGSDEAHISILENQADAERVELDLSPGRFQAPVWSSDGTHFFYIASNDNGNESIYKTNAKTLEQTTLAKLNGFVHMTLSPDDKYLAYLQLERGTPAPFGRVYLVDANSGDRKLLMEDPVASMYWSPNGKKLALLGLRGPNDGSTAQKIQGLAAPLSQDLQLRWWIYDTETEALEPLVSFPPTESFLQTVPYFDQYHLSLTFWSPDSRYFVVAKDNAQKRGGSIWVVDTTGQESPLKIGEGTLAVWSWQ